jgi:nucleoside 2-deoxyribosyltransferase
MKRYFVAYRFSGEPKEVLEERLGLVVEALRKAGIDAYCNFFDQHEIDKHNLNAREVMKKAFAQIDERDGLFVLIASDDKSEGQLIEVGYALAKGKHIISAIQEDVKTYVDSLVHQAINWNKLDDLKTQLEGIKV